MAEKEFNTVALGYFNSKGELVSWSSDTFGSPSQYPKTYQDSKETREMLLKKFTSVEDRKKKSTEFATTIGYAHEAAGRIVEVSERSENSYFEEQDIVEAKVLALDLVTSYELNAYTPKWEDVKNCVDSGNFKVVE